MSGIRRSKLLSSARLGLGDRLSRRRLQTHGSYPPFNGTACLSESKLHPDLGSGVVHVPVRVHRRTRPDGLHSTRSRAPSRVSIARWVSSSRRFLGIGSKRECRNGTQESVSRIFDATATLDAPNFS